MGITLANNAHTTLSADASSTDTTIYVEDIDSFPTLDVGDYFYLTLERTSGAQEIVKVTQINASSFNVVRGQESTIPISFSIGSMAKLNMTVQNITDLIVTGSNVNDEAYGISWDGDTNDAPSRNAIYDKIEALDADTLHNADIGTTVQAWDNTLDGLASQNLTAANGEIMLGSAATSSGDYYWGVKIDDAAPAVGGYIWNLNGTDQWRLNMNYAGNMFLYNPVLGASVFTINDSTNVMAFVTTPTVPGSGYSSGWNGSNEVPTKNDVYDKLVTVDTALASYTAADVLSKLLTVDGAGSGLDADLLDGLSSAAFAQLSGATFFGTVTLANGTLICGDSGFTADANMTIKYDGTTGTGSLLWEKAGTTVWYARSGSSGSWFLRNSALGTSAVSFAVANNNATFTGTVTVPDDAYAAGWDGNLTIPTKNAVYDKIQSLATLADGDKGDITVSASGATWTIDNSTVTLAKMANMATASLIYRKTAGTGAPEVNTLATLKTDLGLTGTNSGDQTITLTGNVTGSGTGSFATTIANNAVTLAKMATMATDSILGRATASTGNVEVLTALPFAFTGDVTRPADSNVQTIANDAVTYAKMQNVSAQYKILGRSTAGAGDVEELSTSANMVSLIASADYSTARTNLGLTALATTTPGTGVATFLATPSSANLLAAVTDETGTGALVFATSPTLVTPALGVATATSIQAPPKISSETTGALTSASRNCIVQCSGGVTLPASGMSDGDSILIDPRGTARTITRPAAHTMYIANTDSATGTTGAHNVVTAVYHGSSKWTVQGSVS